VIERARVCVVTYGDSAASLPALLHGGLSLASAGFQVDLLNSEAAPPSADQHAPGFRSHRFPLRIRNAFRTLRVRGPATRAIAAIVQLLSYCEFIFRAAVTAYRMRADVYEAHDLPALLPTLLAARVRGKPLVYRANEIFSEGHARVPFARLWRALDQLLVPFCDEVVTPEEHRSRIYREEYGAKKEPLTVRNCPPYRPPIESARLRDELRQRGVAFSTLVLYQGLIHPMRCIEELAEATRSFDEGVVLVVLGKGFGSWSDPQARLAGYERMVVLPRVPYHELAPYTASADIGVLLYRNDCRNNYYCAPNKLFEYMMMGLPMVAPSFPGIVPIVEGGNTGLCVDPAQPKQIAAAVNELARAPELRRRMKENGLRLTRERYNWETEFAPMLELYRALLAPGRAGEILPSTSP